MPLQDIVIYEKTANITFNVKSLIDLTPFATLQIAILSTLNVETIVPATLNSIDSTIMDFVTTTTTFAAPGIYKIQSIADGVRGETAVVPVRALFE